MAGDEGLWRIVVRAPGKGSTLEEARVVLGRLVLEAGYYFELLEGVGLVSGNGHHKAQRLQEAALRELEKCWKGRR